MQCEFFTHKACVYATGYALRTAYRLKQRFLVIRRKELRLRQTQFFVWLDTAQHQRQSAVCRLQYGVGHSLGAAGREENVRTLKVGTHVRSWLQQLYPLGDAAEVLTQEFHRPIHVVRHADAQGVAVRGVEKVQCVQCGVDALDLKIVAEHQNAGRRLRERLRRMQSVEVDTVGNSDAVWEAEGGIRLSDGIADAENFIGMQKPAAQVCFEPCGVLRQTMGVEDVGDMTKQRRQPKGQIGAAVDEVGVDKPHTVSPNAPAQKLRSGESAPGQKVDGIAVCLQSVCPVSVPGTGRQNENGLHTLLPQSLGEIAYACHEIAAVGRGVVEKLQDAVHSSSSSVGTLVSLRLTAQNAAAKTRCTCIL